MSLIEELLKQLKDQIEEVEDNAMVLGIVNLIVSAFICVFVLLVLSRVSGCGSWEACKTVEYFEPSKTNPTKMVMVRRVITKAKQAQYLTDSSRTNIKIDMPDLGKVSIGSSLIDAEDVAPIVGVIVEGVVKGLKP